MEIREKTTFEGTDTDNKKTDNSTAVRDKALGLTAQRW